MAFYRRRTLGSYRGTRGIKRRRFSTTRKRVSKFRRIVGRMHPHRVFGAALDRDHYIFEQTAVCKMNWTPLQTAPAGAAFDHGDGWCISMNTLVQTFGPGMGSTNGGLPTSAIVGQGLYFALVGQSGNNVYPDGLKTAFDRFKYLCVVRGQYDLEISQDTPGTAQVTGSTKVAVCGFSSNIAMSTLGSAVGGHTIYPIDGASLSNSDEDSMAGLLAEPNAVSKLVTPFAGSRTVTKIRYPFSIAKYSVPGHTTNSLFWQGGLAAADNPDYANAQPFILTQLLSTGGSTPLTYRVEMKMRWYAIAFQRKLNATIE